MRAALVTLAVGEVPEVRWSHPIFRAYARRHGLDFVVIDEWRVRKGGWFTPKRKRAQFEKLQLHRVLGDYERVIFFDADILIHPDCPNLLDLVPVDCLGAVSDELPDGGGESWKRRDDLERAQWALGMLPAERVAEPYFNTGVMVASRTCRAVFDPERRWPSKGRWREQTGINYNARKDGVQVRYLGREYNFAPIEPDSWRNHGIRLGGRVSGALVVHYAGLADRPCMSEDAAWFLDKWKTNDNIGCQRRI
ncbi:glycosyltransferase [Opitutaceae bacterium TAV4]|nr:glycosyltransferase [Opitutaceae bacterium TAV4]RRK01698.1 glycosyltransferase [Opitutaceae bacterium TAV3]